jgi:tripartite-type tricarboxylate transporter receptor subunit TctC
MGFSKRGIFLNQILLSISKNRRQNKMRIHLLRPRTLLSLFFLIVLLSTEWGYAQEDIAKYPSRPITFIVAYSPGGTGDLAIRLMSKEAEKYLGQPIVVTNKTGGGGTIGAAAVATAKPDGYTIGQSPSGGALVVIPFTEKIPFHPINDFKYIMQPVEFDMGVVVKAESPFKTFKDLLAYAQQNPKKVTYGTNAPNSIPNLIVEQIAKKEGVQFTHMPFKSSTEYQTALLGDHVQFVAGDFSYPFVEAAETRILLLLTGKRSTEYPQVPLSKDLGYDIPCPSFVGVAGPKGLPDEIVKKLDDAFAKAIKEPTFVKGMKELRVTILYRNSKELTEFVTYNYEFFGKLLKERGLIK